MLPIRGIAIAPPGTSRLSTSVAGRLPVGKDLLSFSRPLCGEG
jgi:hypothetical protein